MKSKWTQEQIDGFHLWHENRMSELQYPEEVKKELRNARMRWIPQAKSVEEIMTGLCVTLPNFTIKPYNNAPVVGNYSAEVIRRIADYGLKEVQEAMFGEPWCIDMMTKNWTVAVSRALYSSEYGSCEDVFSVSFDMEGSTTTRGSDFVAYYISVENDMPVHCRDVWIGDGWK